MLTKKRRLTKEEIKNIKEKGQYWETPFFSLLYIKKENSLSKFAFILSKKVSKKAVERNRAKRILAGSTRKLIKKIHEGYWVLFLVKRTAIGQNQLIIAPQIHQAFKKIRLLKE